MGRFVDLNAPLSQEDIDYLKGRGRSYLLAANFRRFGTPDEPREPEAHEAVIGSPAQSPFYSSPDRDAAVYDVGGAPLPNTTLDYNSGRVFDRENGVTTLEFNPISHTAGAHPSQFQEGDFNVADEDHIDDDIVNHITELDDDGLDKELEENGLKLPEKPESVKSKNVDELKEIAVELELSQPAGYKKADLVKSIEDKLAEHHRFQKEDALAVHLQDKRDSEKKAAQEAGDQTAEFSESDEPA